MVSLKPQKSYSDEFKRDAIRLLETSGKPVSVIERELGFRRAYSANGKSGFRYISKQSPSN